MDFMRLNEKSKFVNDNKNIALLTNIYSTDNELYDGVFIFQLFEKFKDNNITSHLDYLENGLLDALNFFIIDEENINIFKSHLSTQDISFDLIIINESVFDSNFFDLDLLNLIIEVSKINNVKLLFDIDDNLDLLDSFYDDSNCYLLKSLVQNGDLITTSDSNLKSKLIDFNDNIVLMPKLLNIESDSHSFKLFKKWCILLNSIFKNDLILDAIIEYLTEIAEYDIIYNRLSHENKYKITVVIPIYNTGKKLRRTLKSIEYQTMGIEYIEVLMINDCSTDEVTLGILNEFVQKDNFKLVDLKDNQGRPGIPRNIGIKESSADYIMFLDHDDFFEISSLERLYNEMVFDENELDLVFGTYATVRNEKSTIYFDEKDINGYVKDLSESPRLMVYPAPSIWTKLFRKEFIVQNNILFPHILGEDAIFMDKVFLNAKGIKFLQKALISFHDLGEQSITNNVTLRYLREGLFSEQYFVEYFESINEPIYSKFRTDVLAYFFLKKFLDANLTEKEIRLIFPKYLWAMNQIKKYGAQLIYNNDVYETILSGNLEKLIKIKLPNSNKQNILYVTILDKSNSFPLIDSLDELLNHVNVYAITYTDFKIKLWSCNLNTFTLIKEIKFNDRIPNFYQLNSFYNYIFNSFKIDKVFFRYFDSNEYMFYFRSMIQTQNITPISFASKKDIVTIYGENSKELLNNLDFNYLDSDNINPHNEKGVIYTAIFGDYEPLLDPKIINENLDYICFTDNPNLESKVWNIKLIPDFIDDFHFKDNNGNEISFLDLDYTRQARAIKILPHKFLKEYDFSIWVDAGFLIVGDVIKYVNRYTKKDFLCISHSVRHCLYDEAEEVLRLNMDDNDLILKQIEKYKNENYPKNNGLIESGVLFRRHNSTKIISTMEDWFDEIINFCKRDQLSFNYVAWKNNLDFDIANMYCTRNAYFHHYFHRVKSIINNKVTLNEFRVILIDNSDMDNLKLSINEINKINDYIPISIITNNKNIHKYLECDFYNLEILHSDGDISPQVIKDATSKKSEKYIHIMNAGEILDYEFVLKNI